jgi:hypothetical protein
LRSPTKLLLAAALLAAGFGTAAASEPSVAQLDAAARAVGNRRDLAEHIGDTVFATKWPAEVTQISANGLDAHLVVGIRVLGIKFHEPMTREQFADEVVALINDAFTAAPTAEEVDLWASVPISVAKGVIVSGDLAKPTSRTVFSVSAGRDESAESLRSRISASGDGVFMDESWARSAFKNDV